MVTYLTACVFGRTGSFWPYSIVLLALLPAMQNTKIFLYNVICEPKKYVQIIKNSKSLAGGFNRGNDNIRLNWIPLVKIHYNLKNQDIFLRNSDFLANIISNPSFGSIFKL